MKKCVLWCLVMALVLCVGLSGCSGELAPEQAEQFHGDWLLEGFPDDVMPPMITLLADGSARISGQGELTWTAKKGKNDNEIARVEIREKDSLIYTLRVEQTVIHEMEFISGTLWDKQENFCGNFNKNMPVSMYQNRKALCRTWYPRGNNWNEMVITLNDDGTCVVDGNDYRWMLERYSFYNENDAGFFIYNEEGIVYNAHLFQTETGGIAMDLNTFGDIGEHIDSYYNSKLISEVSNNVTWYAFDRENPITNYLYWDIYGLSFDGDQQPCRMGEYTDDSVTAYVPNAENPVYILTMFRNGDYPELVVEMVESGEKIHYYHGDHEYDPENPEALYAQAMEMIGYYLEDVTYWDASGETYSDGDLLKLAYAHLTRLGDYRQAQEYLARFTIQPQKLMAITQNQVDSLGNVFTNDWISYRYDIQGNLCRFTDDATVALFGLSADGFPVHCFETFVTYNEEHRITDITVISHDAIYEICTPEYDENGNLVKLSIQKTDGAEESLFRYDEQNRLVEIQMPNGSYTWEYDEAGQMIRSVLTRKNESVATDYAYENGVLTEKTEHHTYRNTNWTVSFRFTCDEQGRPVRADVTSDRSGYKYVSDEYLYTYEDIYFYTAD